MNKKIKTLVISLLLCIALCCMFACGAKTNDPTVTSIAMATTPKTEYYIGDEFDITGGKITVTYSDETTESIDITLEMVTISRLNDGRGKDCKRFLLGKDDFLSN